MRKFPSVCRSFTIEFFLSIILLTQYFGNFLFDFLEGRLQFFYDERLLRVLLDCYFHQMSRVLLFLTLLFKGGADFPEFLIVVQQHFLEFLFHEIYVVLEFFFFLLLRVLILFLQRLCMIRKLL